MAGKIVVRSNNVMHAPLLVADNAHVIEFRDSGENLNALMVKVFGDGNDLWGLVTKNDPDWRETLVRYGYEDLSQPIEEVIRDGI